MGREGEADQQHIKASSLSKQPVPAELQFLLPPQQPTAATATAAEMTFSFLTNPGKIKHLLMIDP